MRRISRTLGVAWDLLAALEFGCAKCEANHLSETLDPGSGAKGAGVRGTAIHSGGGVTVGERRVLAGEQDRSGVRRCVTAEDRRDDRVGLDGA
jgi:hypothetical protein